MTETPHLTIDAPAPDFLLRDLDGHPHTLNHSRGRVVILNFWSAECPWSKRADQEIASFLRAWEGKVEWISIAPNANETTEAIRAAALERGIPVVLRDPDREVTEMYGAETTPHIFVIDSAGILRYQGAFDDVTFRQPTPSRNYLREAVEAVLGGGAPSVSSAPPYGCTIVYFDQP